jgi:hypothetical protein
MGGVTETCGGDGPCPKVLATIRIEAVNMTGLEAEVARPWSPDLAWNQLTAV